MHGVPADLDLSKFKDATLIQLAIGEHEIQFRFHPNRTILVQGHWELRDTAGRLIDKDEANNAQREAYRLHIILGRDIENCSVSAPHSFSLRFKSGHVLTVFDDSKQYESFSIQPGNIYV